MYPAAKRLRRRIWWSVYVLDRTMSINGLRAWGREISNYDCGVELLNFDDFSLHTSDSCANEIKSRFEAGAFIEKVRLCWSVDGNYGSRRLCQTTTKSIERDNMDSKATWDVASIESDLAGSPPPILSTAWIEDEFVDLGSPSSMEDCATPSSEENLPPNDVQWTASHVSIVQPSPVIDFAHFIDDDSIIRDAKDGDEKRGKRSITAWELDCEDSSIVEV